MGSMTVLILLVVGLIALWLLKRVIKAALVLGAIGAVAALAYYIDLTAILSFLQ